MEELERRIRSVTEPENITLRTRIEFREEVREFRGETRDKLAEHSHPLSSLNARLTSVEGRLTSLEKHMAARLTMVPVMNERRDRFEARLSALEARQSG